MPASGDEQHEPPRHRCHAHAAPAARRMSVRGPVVSMLMCSCLDCQRATGIGPCQRGTGAGRGADDLAGNTNPSIGQAIRGRSSRVTSAPNAARRSMAQSSRAPDIRMIPVGFFAGQNDWFDAQSADLRPQPAGMGPDCRPPAPARDLSARAAMSLASKNCPTASAPAGARIPAITEQKMFGGRCFMLAWQHAGLPDEGRRPAGPRRQGRL